MTPNRPVPAMATYVKQFAEDSFRKLSPYILAGNYNNEYIRGNQNKRIDRSTMTIKEREDVRNNQIYREKRVFNRMLSIYLSRYGILGDNMPIPGFKATEHTAKKAYDCLYGNQFLRSFMIDCGFGKLYRKAIKSGDMFGIAWIKTGIDMDDGEEICEYEYDVVNEKLNTTTKLRTKLKEGRVFLSYIPIQDVLIDNYYAESMDEIKELVHRRVLTLDQIKARYKFNEVVREDIAAGRQKTFPFFAAADLHFSGLVPEAQYAYVYEYYKAPDIAHPDGRFTIVINDLVILDGPLPYKNALGGKRKIPFDYFNLQSLPNYTIGTTVYGQIIPMQDTYNSIKNRYIEHMSHQAVGQVYYWEGSLLNKENFSTRPGQMIGLKRNAKMPQPRTVAQIGMEFLNFLRTVEEDMLITAGLSPLTAYGAAKSAMRTDGVVDKVSESDQNKLTNAIDNISYATIEIFKKVCYLEMQRQELLTTSLHLARKDDYVLKYKLKNIDVEQLDIVNREFLKNNDQVRDKKMQQVSAIGLYAPQSGLSFRSKIEFLDALDAGYLRDTLDPVERATHDLIAEEESKMYEGTVPKVEEFHVHQQHIFEHNLFRISPEIRRLEADDPKRYELLLEIVKKHIDEHKKFASEGREKQAYYDAKDPMRTAGGKPPFKKSQPFQSNFKPGMPGTQPQMGGGQWPRP